MQGMQPCFTLTFNSGGKALSISLSHEAWPNPEPDSEGQVGPRLPLRARAQGCDQGSAIHRGRQHFLNPGPLLGLGRTWATMGCRLHSPCPWTSLLHKILRAKFQHKSRARSLSRRRPQNLGGTGNLKRQSLMQFLERWDFRGCSQSGRQCIFPRRLVEGSRGRHETHKLMQTGICVRLFSLFFQV